MSVPQRRAVIDVGTNSVKLLVGEVHQRTLTPIWEESRQTRLGEGFYATRRLQPKPLSRTVAAIKMFADKARGHQAELISVIATSAARDAENREQLIHAVAREAGMAVKIISGEQEAEWAFQGVCSNREFLRQNLVIMDLGGGSMEIIVGDHGHARFSRSFPLGCVRLLEKFPHSDPPLPSEHAACREEIERFLREAVKPVLEMAFNENHAAHLLVGTGGTATILARMEKQMEGFDRELLESARFSCARVGEWASRLWSLSLEKRKAIIGLPASRADVILFGTAIYQAMMQQFKLPEMRVSTRGLRFAALLNAF